MTRFDCSAVSEQGADPDANEDSFALDAELGLFVIADGVGGRPGGAKASRTAAQSFLEQLRTLEPPLRVLESNLRSAVAKANREVRSLAEADPMLAGLATTLSAVVMQGAKGKVVHIGDGRIYIFRNGRLEQLTKDHTLVAELVERGHLAPEAASRFPLRNVLARALGPQESVEPDIADLELTSQDWLLLATDGLAKALGREQLRSLVESFASGSAESLCREIMKAALAHEPSDNVTLAVAKLAG